MTEWYFFWVEGLRGPMPQKWSSDGLWGQAGRQDVIVRFALSEAETHLPLDELARRHPIPDRKSPAATGISQLEWWNIGFVRNDADLISLPG